MSSTTFSWHVSSVITEFLMPSNLPAAVTPFTPPASCLNQWWSSTDNGTETTVLAGFPRNSNFSDNYVSDYVPACFPGQQLEAILLSPGVCPSDHEIVGMLVGSQSFTRTEWGSTTGSELWEADCCKTGFTPSGEGNTICKSTFSKTITATVWGMTTSSAGSKNWLFTPATFTSGVAIHEPYHVYWQYSDLSRFPPSIGTSLAKFMGVVYPGSPSSTESTQSTPTDSAESAPNTNLGLGIGLGISLALALIGLVVLLLYIRRRRQRRVRRSLPPELEGSWTSTWKRRVGGAWRSEKEGDGVIGEIDGSPRGSPEPPPLPARPPVELYAGRMDEDRSEGDGQGMLQVDGEPHDVISGRRQSSN